MFLRCFDLSSAIYPAGRIWFIFAILLAFQRANAADEPVVTDLIRRAQDAFSNGRREEAMGLAAKAIAADPKNARAYFVRAQLHAQSDERTNALADFNETLKLDPSMAAAWQDRGVVHFKLGQIDESISDFDHFLELNPAQAPYHWQRGICYYYAGRFEDGRRQFELHQTVNANDVENAVWHLLCVARSGGLEKARASLIPIRGDPRVPMKEIHSLFAGVGKPEDVLKAASSGEPSQQEQRRRLFYAHLYLGLYFEALGDGTQSLAHIAQAAQEYGGSDYMSDVARVHLILRKSKKRKEGNQ